MLQLTKASWRAQLERALRRDDPVSVNHRAAAFLASWFDVLFALNRQPHPGEKRLLHHAGTLCPLRPADTDATVRRFLGLAAAMDPATMAEADALLRDLDGLLRKAGLIPSP